MSQGTSGVDKLAWLKARGYVRDFERRSRPEQPLYYEVVTNDGQVHEWSFRAVKQFWVGVIAARIRHNITDDTPTLELECQECTQRFASIALADRHLVDDEECGMAQGHFNVVERRK